MPVGDIKYYQVCPFCGLNRPLETMRGRRIKDEPMDTSSIFIDAREVIGGAGGVKGGRAGFPRSPENTLNIVEAAESDEFRDTVQDLKETTIHVARLLIEIGELNRGEI